MEEALSYQPRMHQNTLCLKSGRLIEFDGVLRDHLATNDLHICVLEDKPSHKRAIVTLNEEGEVLWCRLLVDPLNSNNSFNHWIEKEDDTFSGSFMNRDPIIIKCHLIF